MKYIPASTGLLLAVVLSACVPSLHPFYTETDLVFDPALLGEWVEEDIAAGSPLLRIANEARAPQHPARDAHNEGSRRLHDYLHQTASAAGIPDPDGLIEEFELLAQGVISEAARSSTPRAAHVAAHAATRLLATALPE